jgi:hypothetical protein
LSVSDHDRLKLTLLLLPRFACSSCFSGNRLFTVLPLAHARFSRCCCPHRWCHADLVVNKFRLLLLLLADAQTISLLLLLLSWWGA